MATSEASFAATLGVPILSLDIGRCLSHDLGFAWKVNESKLRLIVGERRSGHDQSENTAHKKETYRKEEAARKKRSKGSSATLDLANHC